ncbi:outer membrane protein assembly factor BamB [Psychrobacter arenosus]|uniref:outer membrane protein assembly factor BamB n=1 Tax=Psychrobacter arenosus TaxID=256326 RepID=UPI00191AAFE2|nr:outer membrane protein assembly factor BamB [Psychrobacter arenosus]
MTVFPSKLRQSPLKTTLLYSALIGVLATQVVGCNRGIKPEAKEPVKLVKLAQPLAVLQPVLSVDVGSKGASSKDPLDLQVGYGEGRLIASSRGGVLSAHDTAGKRLWSVDLKEPVTGGVAYDVASQTAIVSTRSGRIIAVDAQSGAQRWVQQLSGSVLTPALIHNNRVIVSANDGFLHGLSLQTGQSIWQFATQVPAVSIRGSAKPTLLDNDTALLATADGRVHAIGIESGIPLWSRRIGLGMGSSEVERMSDLDAMPIVDQGQLYAISYSGQMIGVDLAAGQVMFVNEAASTRALAVAKGMVFATTLDGAVQAYNRTTGEPVWESKDLTYRQLTNPVAIGNYLAVGDLEGIVHIFDATTGDIVSRVQTKGALRSLQVQGNLLMAQSSSGQVAVWQVAR